MTIHNVKTQTQWFDRVKAGEKRAEIRVHDRDYQVGDVLHMTEANASGYPITYPTDGSPAEGPDAGHRTLDVVITHVLPGRMAAGIADGHCLLSIELA